MDAKPVYSSMGSAEIHLIVKNGASQYGLDEKLAPVTRHETAGPENNDNNENTLREIAVQANSDSVSEVQHLNME